MKNLLTIAVTAVIVSLDSFVAGFSLSLNKKANLMLPSAVALITLVLCLATTLIGQLLQGYLGKVVDYFGAGLLALLALISLTKGDDDEKANLSTVTMSESLTIGVAVGMDAAVANLSLALLGVGLLAPIVFAITHFFTVLLGQLLARKVKLEHTNIFSAVILMALAISKMI
ncbi:MAG: manganese efflux pump [Clostridiales bacterium]|nr:manganese efflux pump [Clostridiales bacterium]